MSFTLGQWVSVRAEVVTAREEMSKWGSGTPYYRNQAKGDRNRMLHNFTVVHRPAIESSSIKVCLMRREYPSPQRMLVVGKTYRATGIYLRGYSPLSIYEESEPPMLNEDKRHTVYVLRDKLRWGRFTLALAEDMEAIDEA